MHNRAASNRLMGLSGRFLAVATASVGLITLWSDPVTAAIARTNAPLIHFSPSGAIGDASAKKSSSPTPLIDHEGAMLPTAHVYLIWWGPSSAWPSDVQPGIISFYQGLNGSSYVNTANQYMRGGSESVSLIDSRSDPSVPPSKLSAYELGPEIAKVYPSADPDGYYVVYTSGGQNPNASKICANHSAASVDGTVVATAYIPNVAACTIANLYGLSESATLQALADSSAHEFMEAITDFQLGAWYDEFGQEIADKCAYTYGSPVTLSNGSTWQLQRMWSNAVNGCVQTT